MVDQRFSIVFKSEQFADQTIQILCLNPCFFCQLMACLVLSRNWPSHHLQLCEGSFKTLPIILPQNSTPPTLDSADNTRLRWRRARNATSKILRIQPGGHTSEPSSVARDSLVKITFEKFDFQYLQAHSTQCLKEAVSPATSLQCLETDHSVEVRSTGRVKNCFPWWVLFPYHLFSKTTHISRR